MVSLHHNDNKVETVQRRAAMWATRDYRYTHSVTAMLNDLNWHPLDQRRIDSRLVDFIFLSFGIMDSIVEHLN